MRSCAIGGVSKVKETALLLLRVVVLIVLLLA